jgi:hypothetical protein
MGLAVVVVTVVGGNIVVLVVVVTEVGLVVWTIEAVVWLAVVDFTVPQADGRAVDNSTITAKKAAIHMGRCGRVDTC